MTLVRWSDIGVVEEPDAFVIFPCNSGHEDHAYSYDDAKARRLIARCRELGGTEFRASPDLCKMLVDWHYDTAAWAHGFNLTCDHSLPPNTVIRADAVGGEA